MRKENNLDNFQLQDRQLVSLHQLMNDFADIFFFGGGFTEEGGNLESLKQEIYYLHFPFFVL